MWRQEDFYDVFASLALAKGTVIAVESTSFVSAELHRCRCRRRAADNVRRTGATIHEEDTTPVKSYFQVDAIALKMTLNASWGMRVPQHVSIVEGVSW